MYTENYVPRTEYDAFNPDGTAKIRNQQVAIVYVDFPDGRCMEGNIRKQPTTISQLSQVVNKDAVGEIGLTHSWSPFPVVAGNTTLYINPCKYKWEDRWNMFFSTGGVYVGSTHPDYPTHYSINGTKAYGSFKEYWTEISNSYYNIIPAETHPGEQNPMYRSGIVNNRMDIGGNNIIEYIMLPLNKYGNNESVAYFPNHNSYYFEGNPGTHRIEVMCNHAVQRLIAMHNNDSLEFDYEQFITNGGKVIIIIAGSHSKFKGVAYMGNGNCIVRGMYDKIDNINATIDGITCLTHEFAHIGLQWKHTIAGRNCLMNKDQTKDINCPSHPSPIFKLKEGWVTPVHLNLSQNAEINPVVTSKQVGIITIYGNPSAAPDHLSGECYVVENRKRLGFDKKIFNDDEIYSIYKGGLLVWHYSPYGNFYNLPGFDLNENIKFITPRGNETLEVIYTSSGNPEFFFAYLQGLSENLFYNLYSQRTFSQYGIKTGLEILNIHQANYGDVNSNIIFNVNYSISVPPLYDYTILSNTPFSLISTEGRIYYHKKSTNEIYLNLLPGARVDLPPNTGIHVEGIEASGTTSNKITFGGVGFENSNESYYCKHSGMNQSNFKQYVSVDSTIFKNVDFLDVNNDCSVIYLIYSSSINPTVIENITSDRKQNNFDIRLGKVPIVKMCVNNLNCEFTMIKGIGDIELNNCKVQFRNGEHNFSDTCNVIFNDCDVSNYSGNEFKTPNIHWNGFILNGGNINLHDDVIFRDASWGLRLNNLSGQLCIMNCKFNNLFYDICIDNYNPMIPVENYIKYNEFNAHGNYQYSSLSIVNTGELKILNNNFNDVSGSAIYLNNCNSPEIKNNIIEGFDKDESIGIFSYLSNGYYECNEISKCERGIVLDNSQPSLYNNEIFVNGIGLYLTNHSYPVMSPAYLQNSTYTLAGYNYIRNNSGNEIYIHNTSNALNNLLMDYGNNKIEDNDETALIYMNNDGLTIEPEIVSCRENYWNNGTDPYNFLVPIEYFEYIPYLTQEPVAPNECNISIINDDNSSLNPQLLLLGNSLVSAYNNDYNSAVTYSTTLSNSSGNITYKKAGFRGILINKILSGTGLNQLSQLYFQYMNNYQNDTLMFKHLRNLKIESEVIDSAYCEALSNLDLILINSVNLYERHYSIIEKLRILNILDSVLNGGGDNPIVINTKNEIENILLNGEYKNAFRRNTVSEKIKNIEDELEKDIKYYKSQSNDNQRTIVNKKLLLDLLIINHLSGIPSIDSKKTFLKNKIQNVLSTSLEYELRQNYPNPFNPVTNIQFDIPKEGLVTLKVYDILGREVRNIVNEFKQAGSYIVSFDGSALASGIYLYRIQVTDARGYNVQFAQTKRMILIK